jgi:hypothetical protein
VETSTQLSSDRNSWLYGYHTAIPVECIRIDGDSNYTGTSLKYVELQGKQDCKFKNTISDYGKNNDM